MNEPEIVVRIYSKTSWRTRSVKDLNIFLQILHDFHALSHVRPAIHMVKGEEERKNSTASIEAPLAEELVNKSSTAHVLELGQNQG